jgi:hypothetical protein
MIIAEDKLVWPLWLKGGYEWREIAFPNDRTEWFLTIPKLADQSGDAFKDGINKAAIRSLPTAPRGYRPSENRSLLARFSAIDLSSDESAREGILAFAETFGHLGIDEDLPRDTAYERLRMLNMPDPKAAIEEWEVEFRKAFVQKNQGEPFVSWALEIGLINDAMEIYKFVSSRGESEVPYVEMLDIARREFPAEFDAVDRVENPEKHSALLERVAASAVNKQSLIASSLIRISGLIHRGLDGEIAPVCQVSDAVDGVDFRLAPNTLRGAIWLHLARLFSSGNRWKICGYCGEIFEARSVKAQYCRQSHQQMAHRKRKKTNNNE